MCALDPFINQITTALPLHLHSELQTIRQNYRLLRVLQIHPESVSFYNSLNKKNQPEDADFLEIFRQLWNQQPLHILHTNRNLPPLINTKAIDPHLTYVINWVTIICPNIGGVFYILGSYSVYILCNWKHVFFNWIVCEFL